MSSATEVFDPYREWLGIEPHELPADHYRLLGVARFESDAAKIQAAADERMSLIRSNQTGPRGAFAHNLLNELSAAKLCLLSPAAKAQYDKDLFARIAPLVARPLPATGGRPLAPLAYPVYSPRASTLDPPLAAPPVVPMAMPLAPPKQAPRSEVAVDADKPPEDETSEPPRSRLRTFAWLMLGILIIGGTIWGARRYFVPSVEKTAIAENTTSGDEEKKASETSTDPAAKATLVMQEGSGEVNLPPSAAVVHGTVAVKIDISENVLTGWTSPDDSALWKFKLLRPGFFRLELTYAAAAEKEETGLELLLDDEPLHKFHLHSTGGIDKFETLSYTIVAKSSGTQYLRLRPTAAVAENSLSVKSLRLIPIGGQP